jgi:hypothetical protein
MNALGTMNCLEIHEAALGTVKMPKNLDEANAMPKR